MLYLEAPIGPIKGMMIYRDHLDKGLFFYIPERPRLALNEGVPEFIYLKYRRDITDNADFDAETKQSLGGGFVSFTVDLGVTDEQLNEIKNELSAFADGSDVRLTPVPFRKGSVRLSLSKDRAETPAAEPDEPKGMTFIEEIYGATKPSLFGFNRATFSLVLPQEAATLFEDALRSGISPFGVIYDCEFVGLSPAFNVKITAEYKRIYDHLETQFGARGQIYAVALAVDIAAAFQKLRDEGAIKVEVTNFTDDENLRKQADDAFNWFKTELLKDFFKSALEPPSFMRQTGGGGGLAAQLQSLLGSLGTPQNAPSQPQRAAPTTAPATPAAEPTSVGSNVDSTAESGRSTSSGNAAGGGNHGSGSGADSSIAPFQIAFSLKFYHQEELKTRSFEYSMQTAVARDAAPQGMFSTVVEGMNLARAIREVDLDDEFFKRLVATVSMGSDLSEAGISNVTVNLEYPGKLPANGQPEHVDGFEFTPAKLDPGTFTTWLNRKKDLSYRYKLDIHFAPNSPWEGQDSHITSDWLVTRDRRLSLAPLDELELFDLEVALSSVGTDQIAEVRVDVRYDDPANMFRTDKAFVLKPGDPSGHWRLRLSHPESRSYQYKITYTLPGGGQIEDDWTTMAMSVQRQSLVVGSPFHGVLNVRMIPLVDPSEILEGTIDVNYIDASRGYQRNHQELFTSETADGMKRRTISIPTLEENPQNYTYEVTMVRADGSVFTSGEQVGNGPVVTLSDGAGVARRLKLRLVGPEMAAAGLAALKVDLVGSGEEPDRESVLFTPSQAGERSVSLMQPDGSNTDYTFTITGYNQKGFPVAGDTGTIDDATLLVRVPSAL